MKNIYLTICIPFLFLFLFSIESKSQENKKNFNQDTETFTIKGVSFTMSKVDGGTFTMGVAPKDEVRANKFGQLIPTCRMPFHKVTLHDYYIGTTEVTLALWEAVMEEKVPNTDGYDPNIAMFNVSWADCHKFIKKLNTITGKNFRLPTEAEWEFAAKGGNKSQNYIYAGSNNIDEVAWHETSGKVHSVAQKAPNELGIYDMSGNVQEICEDYNEPCDYKEEIYIKSIIDPQGPPCGYGRVVRGCHANHDDGYLISSRTFTPENTYLYTITGFRLALDKSTPKTIIQKNKSLLNKKNQIDTFKVRGVSFCMVKVEKGTFTMGATPEQGLYAYDNEKPTHKVTLNEYYIGTTEVTQALWNAVMNEKNQKKLIQESKYIHGKGPQCPVYGIYYHEIKIFLSKLNDLTGKKFRLPTEAEWEYAARGGNKSQNYIYAGSDNIDEVAWYEEMTIGKVHSVAQKAPNELGIYDMSGNVSEIIGEDYRQYTAESQTNTISEYHIYNCYRGGGCRDYARCCRVSYRSKYTPDKNIWGFRLALSE